MWESRTPPDFNLAEATRFLVASAAFVGQESRTVAEDRRGGRPQGGRGQSGRPTGGRPSSGRPSGGKPGSGKSGDGRPSGGKPSGGKPYGKRADGKPSGGRPSGDRRSGSSQGSRPSRDRDWKRPADKQVDRSAEQARYDGPPLPEDITGKELDRSIAAQLKGLPEKLAARVARHLVAAGRLIDSDPETAYQHTLAARSRAARLAVVREACGEAAYAAGHYAE